MQNLSGKFVKIDDNITHLLDLFEQKNVSSKHFTELNILKNIHLHKCNYVGTYNGSKISFSSNILKERGHKIISIEELNNF